MPHHKQYVKSLRQDDRRRSSNRSQRTRLRNAMRDFRSQTDPAKAAALLPQVAALLDKGAKTHLIHRRTADRLKSRLALAMGRLPEPATTGAKSA